MKICVKAKKNETIGLLELYDNEGNKLLCSNVNIGKNGLTRNKKEGDGKTPIGVFGLGIAFGIHEKVETKLDYIRIYKNLYWVDDAKSKYYNQLVNIQKVEKDWNSAEHLIDYPKEYEYAIQIKYNENNVPGKGSAIFLHCNVGKPTAGCIALEREKMLEVLKILDKNDLICIDKID